MASPTFREARKLWKEASQILKYRGGRLAEADRKRFADHLKALEEALKASEEGPLAKAAAAVQADLKQHHPVLKKASFLESLRSLGGAVLLALLIRAFLFEAFKIPTGSMIPTLQVGDHLFVHKFLYGLRIPFTHYRIVEGRSPRRGEIAVFEYPGPGEDHGKDFIKRVVAVAGDRVRLQDNRLYINGEAVPVEVLGPAGPCDDATLARCQCQRQRERLGGVEFVTQHLAQTEANLRAGCRNLPDWPMDGSGDGGVPDVVVPDGYVFVMGDNRDNSSDGRYWGFLPVENTKGKALVRWWPPGRWFQAIH
ncbi:signal peptidase I [Myxococcota bacterium]|nr:signal peptidase I [Myxococcota bacterium]